MRMSASLVSHDLNLIFTSSDIANFTSSFHDYFYFYRIMTYFNSLKIISLNCDAKKEEEKKKINIIKNKFKNMYKAGSEFKDEMW